MSDTFQLVESLFSFGGRMNRRDYWLISLCQLTMVLAIWLVLNLTDHAPRIEYLLPGLWLIGAWISLATGVKRWHDLGKSGSWVLIRLVPLIGPFWAAYVKGFKPSTPGPNEWGKASEIKNRPIESVE